MPTHEPQPGSRSVVVTGGSSGVGAALCRRAAAAGWKVWIGYAEGRARAEHLSAEITAGGGCAEPIALRLDASDSIPEAVARIASEDPLPEAAVLSGALPPDTVSLLKLDGMQFRRQFECAVVGHHALLCELWRRCFRPRGGGHVLGVLSAAQGPPVVGHMASYVVAKQAFEALLGACLAEWGAGGLRVSVVRPGFIDTPMLSAFPPLLLQRAVAAAPGRRLLTADAVAAALMERLERPPRPGTLSDAPLLAEAPSSCA